MERVVVVGGGVSGLAVAWHLQRAGVDVTVHEASDRPGGLLRSERADGWLVEWGANGFQDNALPTTDLVAQAGLGRAIVRAPKGTIDRFIVHKGALARLPSKPQQIITTPLLSPLAKVRLLRESKVPRQRVDAPEESVARFARRRFGPDVDAGVDAFVTGVYAGDPEKLSLRHAFPQLARMEHEHGSILTAMRSGKRGTPRPRLTAFKDGMASLPRALAMHIRERIVTGSRVTRVTPRAEGGFTVTREGGDEEHADAVVVALAPNAAARVVEGAAWPEVRTAPVTVVALGYTVDDAPGAKGFGYLAPASERRFALGAVFESNLFPGRAPAKHVLVRALVGGVRHPERAALDDDTVVQRVREDLADLDVTTKDPLPEPAFRRVVRAGAIPQLEVGHGAVVDAARQLEGAHPGLHFTGAGWRTVSVNGLIADAEDVARRLLEERARGK